MCREFVQCLPIDLWRTVSTAGIIVYDGITDPPVVPMDFSRRLLVGRGVVSDDRRGSLLSRAPFGGVQYQKLSLRE